MMVLIPRNSVQELNRDLPREQLHRVLAAMEPTELNIQIPRFTAEFEQDLVPVLSQLQVRLNLNSVQTSKTVISDQRRIYQ